MDKVKVLIVDDSAFMRNALKKMLESDGSISVVSTARDGKEGIEKIKLYKPDVVTLDIEMPRMDGLTALKIIMKENPLPVLMISSLTQEGAASTMEALSLGAVDFIPKEMSFSSLSIMNIKADLIEKIKHIAKKKMFSKQSLHLNRLKKTTASKPTTFTKTATKSQTATSTHDVKKITVPTTKKNNVEIIALGISTGGPKALQEMLPHLPGDLPVGMLVVQHMPKAFTGPFAERLNKLCQVTVKEAEHGEVVRPGTVYIAPGGSHMKLKSTGGRKTIVISDEPSNTIHKPSVDVMMMSVAEAVRGKIMSVIMTGMGSDGAYGMVKIKQLGGITIAESEESCVVFGMPKAAIAKGVVDFVVPLEEIAPTIVSNL